MGSSCLKTQLAYNGNAAYLPQKTPRCYLQKNVILKLNQKLGTYYTHAFQLSYMRVHVWGFCVGFFKMNWPDASKKKKNVQFKFYNVL